MVEDIRSMVDRVIRAAVPPDQQMERRARPESEYSWREPTPAAGLQAALAVVRIAQKQAYQYILGLRGEGTSWAEAADLLQIEWSDQYRRDERAYELVLGPEPEGSYRFTSRNLYWHCGGPLGCGKYITDMGPYDGSPSNNETGHAEDCQRLAAENAAYHRERQLQEHRADVAEAATGRLTDDFAKETVSRARWVIAHGGKYLGWSTSESLAVAIALSDDDELKRHGYSSREDAINRIFQGLRDTPADRDQWVALLQEAATGHQETLTPGKGADA